MMNHMILQIYKIWIKEIFKEFSEVEIKEKNGWLESIFVIIMRIKKSKSF